MVKQNLKKRKEKKKKLAQKPAACHWGPNQRDGTCYDKQPGMPHACWGSFCWSEKRKMWDLGTR